MWRFSLVDVLILFAAVAAAVTFFVSLHREAKSLTEGIPPEALNSAAISAELPYYPYLANPLDQILFVCSCRRLYFFLHECFGKIRDSFFNITTKSSLTTTLDIGWDGRSL